ncbi:MAG: TraB/GumN family protein [Bacteroidetes bacterium]|nr:TraB/GumN family protein [Bacteroidota bacterium]
MRAYFPGKLLAILLLFSLQPLLSPAQNKNAKKYPTLLWEITGNGLKKPSYLFGTMHVSSKMAFHLSDSFYVGIKNAEVVALELDPQLWQDQLFRYQNMQTNLRQYTQGSPNNYLNEKSFQLEKYENKLKLALSEEPTIINGLLYRTFQPKADFEEDTYLDLYIYQTGKKLGKQATGVENYFQTEKLILEATQDMMKDKKKRNPDADGESFYDLERKTQEAYRKGDLDMLDSLERLMQPSAAYLEKFLYRRNEIQADAVDSIVKKHSLFVGVGAAHLPGKRGVIEILRKKGYTLRPISMKDQDAQQRDDIDKVKVSVNFLSFTSDDKYFSVKLPGKLYKRVDSRSGDSWQYADMSNGAYYMITRVKTHSNLFGQKESTVLKKIDSLLYENVPGKILKKTAIVKNGYKGFDVINRTRRGDIQRYNIVATPSEIFIFKISGNGNYVEGPEADQFFNSISLKQNNAIQQTDFEPAHGGFSIKFPQMPYQNLNTGGFDGSSRWEYEALDSTTGDAYMVWKKSIQNYRFLEEDTFDLALMEESFQGSDYIEKILTRKFGTCKGYPCLDASYSLKDGAYIKAKFIVKGPHYYLLAARSQNHNKTFQPFFESFAFTPYRYEQFKSYTDTFVNIRVSTPVIPDIDVDVRNILERTNSEDFLNTVSEYGNYWPKNKTALFMDDSTGEAVYVSTQTYPKYYYPKDSVSFWKQETNENKITQDFTIRSKNPFHMNDSVYGIKYVFSDTNSSRVINSWIFIKDNRLYRMISLGDTLQQESEFVKQFYATLQPLEKKTGEPIFSNKLDLFFRDFYGRDSTMRKKAKDAIPNVYFGPKGVKPLLQAIQTLPYNDKDYFTTKTKLINELGYITDSTVIKKVISGLKNIYDRSADTGTIQNAVFKALSENKTKQSYELLKTLLIQDPPVFTNASDYNYLFQNIEDSLELGKSMFPDLLQLASVDDYKENIRSLLTVLVDSGFIKAGDYNSYFNKLLFDAKIQLKKQQGKDEKELQKKNDDSNTNDNITKPDEDEYSELEDYATLLMPFYDNNPGVPVFFDKLLKTSDASLRLSTTVLLLRNDKKVADSIIQSIASNDQYRSLFLKKLEAANRGNKFPVKYKNQLAIAKSQLAYSHGAGEFFAIEYVGKKEINYKQNTGYVYFFRYKIHNDDDWQMGISGLQPMDQKDVSDDDDLVQLTGKKIKPDQPIEEQFNNQLKRLLFSKHKSAVSFYFDNDYYVERDDED